MKQLYSHPETAVNLSKDHQLSANGSLTNDGNTQVNEISCQNGKPLCKSKNYQWSDEQNRKYYHFLIMLKQTHFHAAAKPKIKKINVQMSGSIQSRTSAQCRSHNQKMLHRFGSVDAIISYFSSYFSTKELAPSIVQQVCNDTQEKEHTKIVISDQQVKKQRQFLWPMTKWDVKYSLMYGLGTKFTLNLPID